MAQWYYHCTNMLHSVAPDFQLKWERPLDESVAEENACTMQSTMDILDELGQIPVHDAEKFKDRCGIQFRNKCPDGALVFLIRLAVNETLDRTHVLQKHGYVSWKKLFARLVMILEADGHYENAKPISSASWDPYSLQILVAYTTATEWPLYATEFQKIIRKRYVDTASDQHWNEIKTRLIEDMNLQNKVGDIETKDLNAEMIKADKKNKLPGLEWDIKIQKERVRNAQDILHLLRQEMLEEYDKAKDEKTFTETEVEKVEDTINAKSTLEDAFQMDKIKERVKHLRTGSANVIKTNLKAQIVLKVGFPKSMKKVGVTLFKTSANLVVAAPSDGMDLIFGFSNSEDGPVPHLVSAYPTFSERSHVLQMLDFNDWNYKSNFEEFDRTGPGRIWWTLPFFSHCTTSAQENWSAIKRLVHDVPHSNAANSWTEIEQFIEGTSDRTPKDFQTALQEEADEMLLKRYRISPEELKTELMKTFATRNTKKICQLQNEENFMPFRMIHNR